MMTKQAELKKQAYASNLKSRALSVLIYLIDRSNKELTCFPAIPTMAEQLHISVSTVKRALKELTEAGYIQKEARFRDRNRGQSSNLYTLLFVDQAPIPDNDNTLVDEDYIEPAILKSEAGEYKSEVVHITFDTLKSEKQKKQTVTKAMGKAVPASLLSQKKTITTPVQFEILGKVLLYYLSDQIGKNVGNFLSYVAPPIQWTGAESILHPP